MVEQVQNQIVSQQGGEIFSLFSTLVEDEYYILHLILQPESLLIVGDIHGNQLLVIQHPEQYMMLQMLLFVLLQNGIPQHGGNEVIMAVSGEQILSMLG